MEEVRWYITQADLALAFNHARNERIYSNRPFFDYKYIENVSYNTSPTTLYDSHVSWKWIFAESNWRTTPGLIMHRGSFLTGEGETGDGYTTVTFKRVYTNINTPRNNNSSWTETASDGVTGIWNETWTTCEVYVKQIPASYYSFKGFSHGGGFITEANGYNPDQVAKFTANQNQMVAYHWKAYMPYDMARNTINGVRYNAINLGNESDIYGDGESTGHGDGIVRFHN